MYISCTHTCISCSFRIVDCNNVVERLYILLYFANLTADGLYFYMNFVNGSCGKVHNSQAAKSIF